MGLKQELIELIQTHLAGELAQAQRASDEPRVAELYRRIQVYRFMPLRDFGEGDVVCPTALVELELDPGATRALYFVTPSGGGFVTSLAGQPVQIVSPQSPIGEAILGHRTGDRIRIQARSGERTYRIVSIR